MRWARLGGFFGRCGYLSIEFEVRSEHLLVRELGFGEQNVPFVMLLAAIFGGLAEGDDGLFLLLRFKANLYVFGSLKKRGLIQPGFTLFGSEL